MSEDNREDGAVMQSDQLTCVCSCSYRLVSLEVKDEDEEVGVRWSDVDWDSLPWFGSSKTEGKSLETKRF